MNYTCARLWDHRIAVMTINEMWDDIAEDNAPPYVPDLVNEIYVGAYADGEYIGMYRLHPLTSVLWKAHAFILPGQRKAHSLQSGETLKTWILENIPDLRMLIADVPECFPNVMAFVKAMGFKEMGFIPDCYTKNGVIGMHQLGISREEMKCQQQQQ